MAQPGALLELADDLEGLSQMLTKENTGSDAGFDDICWRSAQFLREFATRLAPQADGVCDTSIVSDHESRRKVQP